MSNRVSQHLEAPFRLLRFKLPEKMEALADAATASNEQTIPGLEGAQSASTESVGDQQMLQVSLSAAQPAEPEPENQRQEVAEAAESVEGASSEQAAAAVEPTAVEAADSEMQSEQRTAEEPTSELQFVEQSGEDAQASLDSLLGSLASSAPPAPPSAAAAAAEEVAGEEAAIVPEPSSGEGQEDQQTAVDAPMPPFDDITAAISSAPMDGIAQEANAASREAADKQVSTNTELASADISMQQDQSAMDTTQEDVKPFEQPPLRAMSSQPTPAGSPFPELSSEPSKQSQEPVPASYAQAVAPISAAGPSGSVTKTTPLASDPSVAKQTAQQLLDRKPSTLSRLAKLRQRVEKDKTDGPAWLELIQDAVQKGDLEKTRQVYNSFLKVFPDNVRLSLVLRSLIRAHFAARSRLLASIVRQARSQRDGPREPILRQVQCLNPCFLLPFLSNPLTIADSKPPWILP